MSPRDYDPKEVATLQPEQLDTAVRAGVDAFAAAGDLDELAHAHTTHLGPRSETALARRELGALPPNARAEAGRRVNEAMQVLQEAYAGRRDALERDRDERVLGDERVDVTLPWDRRPVGGRHPLTLIQERVADVFVGMGWEIAEGPEVEAEWLNFDALNIPPAHPARETQDTLWVEAPAGGVVLRTHTSPV